MRSIGFGFERIALLALAWPRIAAVVFFAGVVILGYGFSQIRFDEDLRSTFAGPNSAYQAYERTIGEFFDPENETLILVEGDIGSPANFAKLEQVQLELQFVQGVDSVYSL